MEGMGNTNMGIGRLGRKRPNPITNKPHFRGKTLRNRSVPLNIRGFLLSYRCGRAIPTTTPSPYFFLSTADYKKEDGIPWYAADA